MIFGHSRFSAIGKLTVLIAFVCGLSLGVGSAMAVVIAVGLEFPVCDGG